MRYNAEKQEKKFNRKLERLFAKIDRADARGDVLRMEAYQVIAYALVQKRAAQIQKFEAAADEIVTATIHFDSSGSYYVQFDKQSALSDISIQNETHAKAGSTLTEEKTYTKERSCENCERIK